MKDSRNIKAEEMKRQTQGEERATERERKKEKISKREREKAHCGGFSGGEITQLSLKACMTVFALCILGASGRQTEKQMDKEGVVDTLTGSENVRLQNRAMSGFKGAARVSKSIMTQKNKS